MTHVEGTQLYNTESFGPILSLIVADTVDDAIRIANDTEFGLSSAVWSRDLRAALKVAEGIEAGYAIYIYIYTMMLIFASFRMVTNFEPLQTCAH